MSALKKLQEVQLTKGFAPGKFNVVALLGLMAESGEVVQEFLKVLDPATCSNYHVFKEMKCVVNYLQGIDDTKKYLRKNVDMALCDYVERSEVNLFDEDRFDEELADQLFYLSANALGRGKTLEDLAEILLKKINGLPVRNVSHCNV